MRIHIIKASRKPLLILAMLIAGGISNALAGTEIRLNVLDGPGEGLNDPTPFVPVGGNPATTLGQARLLAFRHAAFILGSHVRPHVTGSPVVIQVDVTMDPLFCNATGAVLGSAGTNTVARDFLNAPFANTYYPIALASSLAGVDLDPGGADASATFNSDFGTNPVCGASGWYYGLDGNAALGQVDFVSVVLHELSHALGFQSFVDLNTGQKFMGRDDTFTNCLALQGAALTPLSTMTNTQRQAAFAAFPNLVWSCPDVTANLGGLVTGTTHDPATGDDHIRMYAPDPIEPGSTGSHFDTTVFPNESMEPFINGPDHTPGLTTNLFTDIGWDVEPDFVGVDVVFIMDLTGSTGGLIPDWIAQIPAIAQSWTDALPGKQVRFGLASHFDYPFAPYANCTTPATGVEWAYKVESQLDANPAALQAALANVDTRMPPNAPFRGTCGGDEPESQYEALYQALTGEGRDFTAPTNFTDLGEIFPVRLSPDSDRPTVIYHFTFPEEFHDPNTEPLYPKNALGTTETRPGLVIPGETQVLAELAERSANNTFFGLTFLSGASVARSSAATPLVLFRARTGGKVAVRSLADAPGPLARLAAVANGAVYNVSSKETPFDLELLQEAIDDSVQVFAATPAAGDSDGDGVSDASDNCPLTPNPDQADFDGDGVGDVCDNCSVIRNANQADRDHNGFGDVCNCQGSSDFDGDGICDDKDLCRGLAQTDITQADTDENGIPDECECGDFDRNGRVNSVDARLIQRCVVGEIACSSLCDVNGDHRCNTADARVIQQLVVGKVKVNQLSCRFKDGPR